MVLTSHPKKKLTADLVSGEQSNIYVVYISFNQSVFHPIYFPLKIKSAEKEQFNNYFNKYKSIITNC